MSSYLCSELIIPIIIELLDVFLLGIILRTLGIIQIQDVDLTDHEGLNGGMIPLLRQGIYLRRNLQLSRLAIEVLHQTSLL